MSDDDLARLLLLYLDVTEHAEDSVAYVEHHDAYDRVAAIIASDVGTAVRLVSVALEMHLSDQEEGYFAASVLEDLIEAHGPAIIDQLVAWSATSERARRMLQVPYHYDFDPNVSRRINEALARYGVTAWTGSTGGERPLRPPRSQS